MVGHENVDALAEIVVGNFAEFTSAVTSVAVSTESINITFLFRLHKISGELFASFREHIISFNAIFLKSRR